ncbi:MAG TPA: 16S rRNA (cytosine(967)-C(5))-methyltransferase RsmB [Burkholderiaceae bacterium]|nr:16S rRNA (cytosine(967)-C(5))-methyltransferase RsmB [Burkholderiaceae bacterium]
MTPLVPAPIALAHLLDHAADMVQGVQAGRSLTDLLAGVPAAARPATQALAFEALRRLGGARAVRRALAPKAPPREVEALLLTALALLWPQARPPYPDHTLVDQAVHAARRRAPASAAFVNAVLRRFVRERETLVAAAERDPVGAFNHPLWWIERLKTEWPTQWRTLLDEANRRPPMTLRVNARRCTPAAYLQRLAAAGRGAQLLAGGAIMLDEPCPVGDLPGFADGEVSVQDAAAQRAAPLLLGEGARRLRPGARVLDACAAPGGKTAHLLELGEFDLLALDSDPQRLTRVQQTLTRLHLHATLRAGDARQPASWWDGRPFDAILLDAPCSASGIVRRHPDIRWLRRPDDVSALARVQAALLDALWPLLAPGGRLLYATCSVFKAEGQAQIDAFLQRPLGSTARLDTASPGHLLPLPDNGPGGASAVADGFYYALLHKSG